MTESKDVIIIGSGLTGLAAARVLAARSIDFLVLEKDFTVGGRMQSEEFEGCILDRGFQVVLPAYPSIKSLNLPIQFHPFSGASTCISAQGMSVLADPIHNFNLFFANLRNSPALLTDLLRLLRHMRSRRFDVSTGILLDQLGYSERLKNDFLKPFLRGVLLDPNLESRSPLSAYFLERFFLGGASLVGGGVQEFPRALAQNLSIEFNSEVIEVSKNEVLTKEGREYSAKVVVDTRPGTAGAEVKWLATRCTYFLSSKSVPLGKRIVLCSTTIPTSINLIANLSEVDESYSPKGHHVWQALQVDETRTAEMHAIRLGATIAGHVATEFTAR